MRSGDKVASAQLLELKAKSPFEATKQTKRKVAKRWVDILQRSVGILQHLAVILQLSVGSLQLEVGLLKLRVRIAQHPTHTP
jgi:hypothetical protein